MSSYENLSATDFFSLIRNVEKNSDDRIKQIFYDIKNKISGEEKKKALYLLKNYRPNLIKATEGGEKNGR